MHRLPGIAIAALITFSPTATAQAPSDETVATESFECFTDEAAQQAENARLRAAAVVMAALDQHETTAKSLRAAAEHAAAELGVASAVAERLRAIETDDVDDIERALERIADNLKFAPMVEAPLPVGWPMTAPVDEVVLKQYPRYRMATTPMRGASETTPFWRLFGHIQSNDIAMTAPVQMDGTDGEDDVGRMAFLYQDESTGPLQSQDGVEVIDVAPTLALSVGARGYRNPKKVAALTARLEAWLTTNGERFERAGPIRVMGYNSPMVSSNRRFFEVELPLRRKPDLEAAHGGGHVIDTVSTPR